MSTSIVVVTSYDPLYLSISAHAVQLETAKGHRVIVFDTTPVQAAPFGSYHHGILSAFRLPHPGHDIRDRMEALDADYRALERVAGDDAPLSDELEQELAEAVLSAINTYERTDHPNLRRRATRRLEAGLTTEGRVIYRAARALCAAEPDAALAYVPNGRFPHQRLAVRAFVDAGIATRHVERGVLTGRAYVQDYAPQERVRSQQSVGEVLAGLSTKRIDEIADSWLASRAPAKDSDNEYTSLWTEGLPDAIAAAKDAGVPLAGFFTSSADEFSSLGPEWQTHTWEDQYAAFDSIITRFEADGFRCYLRVHPNLATKAHEAFRRERDRVRWLAARHPDLIVLWHDDSTNTYTLFDASSAIIVWLSTVGLEANARGLPVWAGATSRYGMIADVRELLSPEALAEADLAPWTVDVHGAKRYVAYLVLRDQDITPGASWLPWDAAAPPFGARLAAAAVSGGTPGHRGVGTLDRRRLAAPQRSGEPDGPAASALALADR